ncbi:MAG: hypothetical protein ACI9RZ_001119, partial [Sphingobacteriales bacterium]
EPQKSAENFFFCIIILISCWTCGTASEVLLIKI